MPMLIRLLKLEKYLFKVHLEQIKNVRLIVINRELTHDNHAINRD